MHAQPDNLERDGDRGRSLTRVSHRYYSGLRVYFYSGWTFLIPYLAAYLFYARMKWPVNPMATGSSSVGGGQWTVIPCLLHVYWALHAIHVVLAIFAIRAWWRRDGEERGATSEAPEPGILPPPTVHRLPETVYRLIPWIFLGLLFYIPGAYLEFPADTWEHYTRINEWAHNTHVGDHYYSIKFSYFLTYSIVGQFHGHLQFFWLDFYYTGACLLLCWQYYKLSRAIGLSTGAAFVFISLQMLFFGNTIFSFYRYYGISSTLFSQLATVAITRTALESVSHIIICKRIREISLHMFFMVCKITVLLMLVRYTHIQGLGISLLALTAVAVWYTIKRWQLMRWYLPLAAVGLSMAAIYVWPRHPAIDEVYRPMGWMTRWYGYNFLPPFSNDSPAADRTLQILGIFGLSNFVAGLVLLRRNHVVGWLTVIPVLALCLPIVAIPFANALARYDVNSILTFHRMFLGIPVGLACVVLCHRLLFITRAHDAGRVKLPYALAFLCMALAAAMIIPPSSPYFNRIWNALMIVPDDLSMRHVVAESDRIHQINKSSTERAPFLITALGIGFISYATGDRNISGLLTYRSIFPNVIPVNNVQLYINDIYNSEGKLYTKLLIPPITRLVSSYSTSGYLSGHWSPQQVALDHMAAAELEEVALHWRAKKTQENGYTYYIFSKPAVK